MRALQTHFQAMSMNGGGAKSSMPAAARLSQERGLALVLVEAKRSLKGMFFLDAASFYMQFLLYAETFLYARLLCCAKYLTYFGVSGVTHGSTYHTYQHLPMMVLLRHPTPAHLSSS